VYNLASVFKRTRSGGASVDQTPAEGDTHFVANAAGTRLVTVSSNGAARWWNLTATPSSRSAARSPAWLEKRFLEALSLLEGQPGLDETVRRYAHHRTGADLSGANAVAEAASGTAPTARVADNRRGSPKKMMPPNRPMEKILAR